jgi:hypothetical protein
MCARSDWVRWNGARQVDLLRECRKVESFSIDRGLKRLSEQSGTALAMEKPMSGLSPGGNTISDNRLWDSNWTYSDSLMPFDPKKSQHGSMSPQKGAVGFELRHNKSNWRFE